jgi:hypothetical protein
VGPDGSYYLEVSPFTTINPVNACPVPAMQTFNPQLLTVSPAGSATYASLPSCSVILGNVIPDGTGGALATTFCANGQALSMKVTDVGGTAAPIATLSVPPDSYTEAEDMVLGDQGTYFTTQGTQNTVVAVNETSGDPVWTWQPSQGNVEIIAATAGGGVAVRNILTDQYGQPTGQEDVVRLDSTGNPTYDTWGTAGGTAGYGVLSNETYFAGVWVGTAGDPVIEGVEGEPLEEAFTAWPDPEGGAPNNGGAKQAVIYHFLPRAITGLDYQQYVENSVPEGPNPNIKIPVRHVSQQFGFDFISNEVDWVTEKDTVAGGYSIADVWGALVLSVGKLRSFVVTAPIRLRGDLTRLRALPTNTLTSS